VGLDIEEKVRWTEEHIRESMGDLVDKFSLLKFHVNGSSPIDAPNQDLATVDMRIFAQSPDIEMFNINNPDSFGRRTMVCILESAPVSQNELRTAPMELILKSTGCLAQQRSPPGARQALSRVLRCTFPPV
jgi:hypothetical protein